MYNPSKVLRLKREAQAEIDEVIKKYSILINEAIKAQVPSGHKMYARMGVCFCENKDGKYVGERFTDQVQLLLYRDCLDTALNIEEIL